MTDKENFEAYCAAGELFGRLSDWIPCGELTMRTDADLDAVCYRWTFRTVVREYSVREFVSLRELWLLRSVEAFSDHLTRRWGIEYQKLESRETP